MCKNIFPKQSACLLLDERDVKLPSDSLTNFQSTIKKKKFPVDFFFIYFFLSTFDSSKTAVDFFTSALFYLLECEREEIIELNHVAHLTQNKIIDLPGVVPGMKNFHFSFFGS